MKRASTTWGFSHTARLLQSRVRKASESRGFAESRLLTHWAEIVGPDMAAMIQPVRVAYGRAMGATLTVLTTGAQAPLVQMQLGQLRDKINACYGYNAIARIQITQTAPTGFAEGQAAFTGPKPKPKAPAPITPEARAAASDVTDPGLRAALEALGSNILTRHQKGTP